MTFFPCHRTCLQPSQQSFKSLSTIISGNCNWTAKLGRAPKQIPHSLPSTLAGCFTVLTVQLPWNSPMIQLTLNLTSTIAAIFCKAGMELPASWRWTLVRWDDNTWQQGGIANIAGRGNPHLGETPDAAGKISEVEKAHLLIHVWYFPSTFFFLRKKYYVIPTKWGAHSLIVTSYNRWK